MTAHWNGLHKCVKSVIRLWQEWVELPKWLDGFRINISGWSPELRACLVDFNLKPQENPPPTAPRQLDAKHTASGRSNYSTACPFSNLSPKSFRDDSSCEVNSLLGFPMVSLCVCYCFHDSFVVVDTLSPLTCDFLLVPTGHTFLSFD